MATLFLPLLILIILSGLPGNSSVKTFQYLTRQYGGSITIPCFYEHKQKDHAKYWCRTKGLQSCTMLDRNETERRIGRERIANNPDKLAFYITMSNLQWYDAGNYWCAVEINGTTEYSENLRLAVTNAQSVWTESWVSAERGGSVTIPCYYDQMHKLHVKYWCRGSNWYSCSILARSDSNQPAGKVSISDDPAHLVFNVTMRDLQDEDADTYWCAIWIEFAVDPGVFLPLMISSAFAAGNVKNITGKELPAGPPTASSGVSPKEVSSTDSTESSSSQLVLLLTLGLLLLLVILLAIVMVAMLNRQGKRPASNDDTQNRLANIPSVDPKNAMIYSTITLQNQEELSSEDPAGLMVYSTLVLKQT
nr:CMRF35-like molecule 8 isoform X1 [Paramormyrops kingsleyae]XP_023700473.1 CMRF35-like molecule 8 isoform X1 [Paramormyrops kingsleyae]XP_023700474.1 CMRF35-like molecule 8 isoform X1 [Paramormyrops kingsleyae]XP_023700475.1 CMRF35-like molecule 8 isoform X1 [Paramormyrops kingsleyae]XP_023700476.1 CMRF35-like molecule 8 isoform X1 [Paramormyrops kingsleyae]